MEKNEIVSTRINPILICVSAVLIIVAVVVGWHVGKNNVECSVDKEVVDADVSDVNYGKWISEFTQIDSLYGGKSYCSAGGKYVGIGLKNDELYKITDENIESLGIKNVVSYSIEHISNACDIFYILYLTTDGNVYSLDIEYNNSKFIVGDVDYYSCVSDFTTGVETFSCTYNKKGDHSFAKFELDAI